MDYFNEVLTTFLGLESGSYIAIYAGSVSSRISPKYLNLSSEDEQRSYGFGTTWGWVINDSISISFLVNYPFKFLMIIFHSLFGHYNVNCKFGPSFEFWNLQNIWIVSMTICFQNKQNNSQWYDFFKSLKLDQTHLRSMTRLSRTCMWYVQLMLWW